ncbi:MAG: cytochrome c oxidase subunit 4, partial [Actinomycetota bacterium]|nr:cytochrome c oxidase subunit 4 [Actinomycetota bacterium]
FWYPKLTGRMLSEKLGKLHFWLMLAGFNLTFAPFHILGLQGMPRRIYTYPEGMGWDVWNFVSTLGSFMIAASIAVFLLNLWKSRHNAKVGADPWDARTLEWSIPSPPPEYNFAEVPLVTARDDLWHRKYTEDEQGRPVLREPVQAEADEKGPPPSAEEGGGERPDEAPEGEHAEEEPHIHMPSPSYWPVFSAVGLAVLCYGVMYKTWVVAVLGAIWILGTLYAWALEPATAPEEPELEETAGAELAPVGAPAAETADRE